MTTQTAPTSGCGEWGLVATTKPPEPWFALAAQGQPAIGRQAAFRPADELSHLKECRPLRFAVARRELAKERSGGGKRVGQTAATSKLSQGRSVLTCKPTASPLLRVFRSRYSGNRNAGRILPICPESPARRRPPAVWRGFAGFLPAASPLQIGDHRLTTDCQSDPYGGIET